MNRLTSRRVCRYLGFLSFTLTCTLINASTALAAQVVGSVVSAPGGQGQPSRDRGPQRRVGTAVIRGRVIDAATGNPVPRARVRVMSGPSAGSPVLTDVEGVFTLTGVPSGNAAIVAEKATYLVGRIPDGNSGTIRTRLQPIMVQDGQVIDNVLVRLYHGAAITGKILDAHGDPVENAQIIAARVVGGSRPVRSGQTQSNDLGEYRLPRLQPGRYIVQVRPQPSQMSFPETAPDVPLPQPIPTYYPGALGLSQAQPIAVRRGETLAGVDMTLVEGTPSLVTGTVVRADGGAPVNGFVNARAVGTESLGPGFDGGAGIRPGGTFQLTLPPGEFMLEASVSSRLGASGPEDQQSGIARINVAGGAVEAITIVVGRSATASGRVVFEGATDPPAPPPTPTNPPLYNPDGPGCRSGQATVAADWTFKVEGLVGTCSAAPVQMFGRWTLKSVTIKGQNVTDQMVTFEPGQHYSDVHIVVTDKRTQVNLQVSGETGQPTKEYVAIAFPVDKTKWNQQSRRVRYYTPSLQTMAFPAGVPIPPGAIAGAGPAGGAAQERFVGLPAGEYYVIAVDDIGSEEWLDPDVLERLTSSATRVALSDDAPVELPLRRVTLADVMR